MTEIIKAIEKDIALIHKLGCEVFPETYAKILEPEQIDYMLDWMYSEKNLAKQMSEGHVYYIGYCDSEPFGYLSVRQEASDTFHLEKIYLRKKFQGKKLGALLFERAKSHILEIHPNPCRMILNVNRENKAYSFYKHMGMRELYSGDFPIGNGYFMNDYIMGLDLP